MKLHPAALIVTTAAVVTGLTGCGVADGTSSSAAPDTTVSAGLGSGPSETETGTDSDSDTGTDSTEAPSSPKKSPSAPKHTSKPKPKTEQGPHISFQVARKPKCEEGTAVFRAEAVPLIIKWKITGAESGALSVDDPTGTPGTYSQVGLEGTEEFTFSCSGEVGSLETHTYTIYSVGGTTQKHKTLKVSAKVMDKGLGTN